MERGQDPINDNWHINTHNLVFLGRQLVRVQTIKMLGIEIEEYVAERIRKAYISWEMLNTTGIHLFAASNRVKILLIKTFIIQSYNLTWSSPIDTKMV